MWDKLVATYPATSPHLFLRPVFIPPPESENRRGYKSGGDEGEVA